MSKTVRVEIGPEGNVLRIFRNKEWKDLPTESVRLMDRSEAVKAVRVQVFDRAFNEDTEQIECERCGRKINWSTGEMNEVVPKGSGGEVSLANCEALCNRCHTGSPDSAHGNRRWQTAKLSSPKE
jgi:5-methylcytosine-specific restriction endonuclease McrA